MPNQLFGEAQFLLGQSFVNDPVDGILGMAISRRGAISTSLIEKMNSLGFLAQPMFGFYLQRCVNFYN